LKIFLDGITIYPVKSTNGITVESSQVLASGLLGDRRYMLINTKGHFVTARQEHILTLIQSQYDEGDKVSLSFTDLNLTKKTLLLDPKKFDQNYDDTIIWETNVRAQLCGKSYDQWFSNILKKDVRLVYFGKESNRFTSRRPEQPVAFADGYPFLITSRASLTALVERCPEIVYMEQFRANLIVDGCDAFIEDSWAKFKIGNVIFETVKPCVRCILTTIKPATAEKSKLGEPFKSLCKFRMLTIDGKLKGPTFGMNLVALNEGSIKLGDEIEVLEYRNAEKYQDNV